MGILKESVPLSCLLFLSGRSCHLKAAKQRANNSSGVNQVVERDKNASVVSGSHQPTMKQKRVDDTASAGLVQLSPHHLLLLSIELLSDQSSSAFIPLCLAVGQKRDLPEHGTGSL